MRVTVPPLADRRRESRFFSTLAMIMAVVVFVGFAPTFYLSSWFPSLAARPAQENFFSLHGTVFSAWIVLLILQTTLVRKGFMQLHRSIGIAGMLLAILLVMTGIYGALLAANRPAGFTGISLPADIFLVVPVCDMVLYGAFVALAYAARRGRKSHKRWIMLATINLLGAAFVRILPQAWLQELSLLPVYVCVDLFIVMLAMWDLKSLGRLHRATLWGGLTIVASQPLRLLLADTVAWQIFASRAMGALATTQ